ncbi:hypothetical protein CKO_04567 [Citrobacter koseri ATCC BAA-895]|uniref:Uncharacterized protein n=1 Tax=Citrobacter koseri (strain ATCC BAA-895 / CDC 4225-83 / SGSC4696) TaxID=290338 RepID=A8AQ57_CITK8|nr:hypothetical protein CKO_04567 [Citrobacter koseri ATCC BAA-895]
MLPGIHTLAALLQPKILRRLFCVGRVSEAPPGMKFKKGLLAPFLSLFWRIYYGERIWSPAARSPGNAKRDRYHPATRN